MENWLNKISAHRYFLLFVMLFGYVQSIYIRLAAHDTINIFMFTPEAVLLALVQVAVLYIIILFFIKLWQRSEGFSTKEAFKILVSSLLVFPLMMQVIGFFISLIAGNLDRNYNKETFIYTTFTFLLQGITYGSFFLVYFYYRRSKNHKRQIEKYHQTLSEFRINQLKAQISPHFLFNNLNILDQFIEEDKNKASAYLNEFAEIYRYVLQATDRKTVEIEEELFFAEHYFRLFQHRYGNAFQLKVELINGEGKIIPMTLQLLLENAIQHNAGTLDIPVNILIKVDEEIIVSNNIKRIFSVKAGGGRGLSNLSEQYKLLTGRPIQILESEMDFVVNIPKIKQAI